MALTTMTGSLRDVSFSRMNNKNVTITFTPHTVGTRGQHLFPTEPITVSPDDLGEFTVSLEETEGLVPAIYYYVTIQWSGGGGNYTRKDDPTWVLVVPKGGGLVANHISKITPTQIITKGEPGDASPVTIALAKEAAAIAANEAIKSDPRMPQLGSSSSILFEVLDALFRSTWLGARRSDGGPTDTTMQHLKDRLGIFSRPEPGILYAITDSAQRFTDIVLRSSDGQITDDVMDRWATRIAQRIGGGGSGGGMLSSDRYVRGAEILPTSTDTTRMIGLGSSSMAGIGGYFTTGLAAAGWPVTFANEGKAGEQSQQIFARMGAAPARITFPGNTIPASGSVTVTTNIPGYQLKTFEGIISGVAGELSYVGPVFTFTRTTAGTATPSPAASQLIPTVGPQYRDAVNLLWGGKNDPATDWQGTIERTDAAFDWLAPLVRRSLVLGHFVDRDDTVGSETYVKVTNINAAHKARYGNLYVDVRAYLASPQLWVDTGITPTTADTTAQANQIKPPSVSSDSGHLNAAGYRGVVAYIIRHITSLGWY